MSSGLSSVHRAGQWLAPLPGAMTDPGMKLIFTSTHSFRPPAVLGSFWSIRVDHQSLKEHAQGPVLAVHDQHQWVVEGARYMRLDVTSAVWIHFERTQDIRSRRMGKYIRFSLIDGLAYSDDELLAHLDRHNEWFCYDLAERWPVIVIAKAVDESKDGSAPAV